MSTYGTNYGISELRIAKALQDAIDYYGSIGTMPGLGTEYGESEKRIAIAIFENTTIGGGNTAVWGNITGNLASQSDLSTALSLKQNTLVSGTNIKTINTNNLLGSGDITINANPAGSSGQIQFNNSGSFGASSKLTWNAANNRLGINNTTPLAQIDVINSLNTQPIQKWTGTTGGTAQITDSGNFVAGVANGTYNGVTPTFDGAVSSGRYLMRGYTKDATQYAQFVLGATNGIDFGSSVSASGIALAAFGASFASNGVYTANSSAFQAVSINGFNLVNEGGPVHIVTGGFATSNRRLSVLSGGNIGINNANPLAQLDVVNSSASQPIVKFTGTASNSSQINNNGSYQPASLTDSSATNNSLYYSTTQSKLAFKNASGTVEVLGGYGVGGIGLSAIRLQATNGYGSSATTVKRWLNTVHAVGSDITYTDSDVNGGTLTINTAGIYAISYTESFSNPDGMGISLNSSTLNGTPSATEYIAYTVQQGGSWAESVAWTGYLPAGSVIRAQTNSGYGSGNPAYCYFSIARLV